MPSTAPVTQTVGRQDIFQTNELRVIMSTNSNMQIRSASIRDKEFIISLLPRLEEFGPPPWPDDSQMLATKIQVLSDMLIHTPPGTAIFIAEDDQSVALGFIHLQTGKDYYYQEAHGHIANIIVAPGGEEHSTGFDYPALSIRPIAEGR